jgi:sulfur-carrier protein
MTEVTILYFASVREVIGVAEERLALPAESSTPASLLQWLKGRSAAHAAAFAQTEKLRCAVDQVMVPMDFAFVDPKEIAFFPPVTGG